MNERYLPSSLDELYDETEFAFNYSPTNNFEQTKKVDLTKKPTTPREASQQSEVYVNQLEDIEGDFENQVNKLKNKKMQAEAYELVNAETVSKFAATFCNELNEIKQTDNPAVQRSLWEDIIDLSSGTQYPHYVYGSWDERNIGKNTLLKFIDRYYITKVIQSAGQDAYWTPDGFLEDPILVWDMVRKIIESGIEESGIFSTKDAHKKLLEETLSGQIFNYPEYDILSSDMWQKINDTVEYVKELINHIQGDPISQGLSDFLSESVDELLNKQRQNLALANEKIQKQKEYVGFDDATIAQRARAIIDEKQQPILQEAREHTQRNVSLLRKAALAEAALDGMNIRRTASRKP
jgi:hypothetical protein